MTTTCGVPMSEGQPCPRNVEDEDDRCYFHSSRMHKAPADFIKRFIAELQRQTDDVEQEKLDFTRFVFPEFSLPPKTEFRKPARFDAARFNGETHFREAVFNGEAGFRETIFSGHTHFTKSKLTRADFGHAIFSGGAEFGEATFEIYVSFTRARLGHADFRDATFNGNYAYFDDMTLDSHQGFLFATFNGVAMFNGTVFSRGAGLCNATFNGPAYFGYATFVGQNDFQRVVFNGETDFTNATFAGETYFWHATFRKRIEWREAIVYPGAKLVFLGSEVESDFWFEDLCYPCIQDATKRYARLRDAWNRDEREHAKEAGRSPLPSPLIPPEQGFQTKKRDVRIDFRNVAIRQSANVRFQGVNALDGDGQPDLMGRLDMSKVRLAHTDVSRIRFANVKWGSVEGSIALWGQAMALGQRRDDMARIVDEEFLYARVRRRRNRRFTSGGGGAVEQDKADPEEHADVHPSHVAAVYKGLRESYEKSKSYSEAGVFHLREMEMRRRTHEKRVMLFLYGLVSLYGESYRLALAWILGVLLFFGAFWRYFGSRQVAVGDTIATRPFTWSDAFLQSIHSLLPSFQSAGDSWPILIERILGVVLLAFFALALNRNFRR